MLICYHSGISCSYVQQISPSDAHFLFLGVKSAKFIVYIAPLIYLDF